MAVPPPLPPNPATPPPPPRTHTRSTPRNATRTRATRGASLGLVVPTISWLLLAARSASDAGADALVTGRVDSGGGAVRLPDFRGTAERRVPLSTFVSVGSKGKYQVRNPCDIVSIASGKRTSEAGNRRGGFGLCLRGGGGGVGGGDGNEVNPVSFPLES